MMANKQMKKLLAGYLRCFLWFGLVSLLAIFTVGVWQKTSAQSTLISATGDEVTESAGSATVTFTISQPQQQIIYSYTYRTEEDNAKEAADYLPKSGSLACEEYPCSVKVPVSIVPNSTVEPTEETFRVIAEAKLEGKIVEEAVAVVTIIDDDKKAPTPTPDPDSTPTPTPDPDPDTNPEPEDDPEPTTHPDEEPVPNNEVTPEPEDQSGSTTLQAEPIRKAFVRSLSAPNELPFDFATIGFSLLLALLLVLLVLFPADMFNSTLLANYEEISNWFRLEKIKKFTQKLHNLPTPITLGAFALVGAIINAQLSPDLGLDRGSLALVAGLFLTLLSVSVVYDVARSLYLKKRFGIKSKLSTQALGMGFGAVLVVISRLANFLPGYLYGIFTALAVRGKIKDEQDGEGLAFASIVLLLIGGAAWFLWIPVKAAASIENPEFIFLVLDSYLASMWIAGVAAIVFGLVPIRFFYGEPVKKWNRLAWAIIYFVGTALFIYTVLHPERGFYGRSDQVELWKVLALFAGFGSFSLLFWSYFRYRHLWRKTT
jgi:hypothetical protein